MPRLPSGYTSGPADSPVDKATEQSTHQTTDPDSYGTVPIPGATMLDGALWWASQGRRVFPLPPGQKAAKMPEWQKKATTDEATIRRWWENSPDSNVGVTLDGWIVVDEDLVNGGDLATLGDLPETRTLNTGTGGRHLVFAQNGRDVKHRTHGLGQGIDVLTGADHYIVAWPSVVAEEAYEAKRDKYEAAGLWPPSGEYTIGNLLAPLPFPSGLADLAEARRRAPSGSPAKRDGTTGLAGLLADGPSDPDLGDEKMTKVAGHFAKMAKNEADYLALVRLVSDNLVDPLKESALQKKLGIFYKEQAKQADGAKYIDRVDGLKASLLATDVLEIGPLAFGVDDRMWSYEGGVWTADPHVVRNRAVALLGNHYRASHARNAEDVSKARVALITCEPVKELINFQNGLLRWETGALEDHSPEVMSTVQLGVPYETDAQCPQFDAFLAEVVPPDMVEMVWELIGYLMYSGNPLHKAVMLTGNGRNGKGTFLRVINELLGVKNVSAVALKDLTDTRFASASLFGKLANIAGDIDGTYLESTATFKAVTGEDVISAEHKGRDRFDFTPWAVPVFSANKVPPSADVSAGYLARWVVIPFPHDFRGREDSKLTDRLIATTELAGIAARAVPALQRLMDRGRFEAPQSAKEATEDFEKRVDQVRMWLDECTELSPDHPHVNRARLHDAYKRWAVRDGHKPVHAQNFRERLESIGLVHATVHGVRGFKGIKITDEGHSVVR